jgi:hypothetical protein
VHRRLPPLNALKAFEAAARHGSFTRAADELHVTHGAVSRHVQVLEAWLGLPLFERHNRRVALTEAGAPTPPRSAPPSTGSPWPPPGRPSAAGRACCT